MASPAKAPKTEGADEGGAAIISIVDEVLRHEERKETWIAFEYFPPRTDAGVQNLIERMGRMKAHNPLYVDVTWGAGGSTSDLTMDLCVQAQKKFGLTANMHLTCTNMPRDKLDRAIVDATKHGIKNILALRGDPPVGQTDWKPVESGFSCALDLVKFLRKETGDQFCISVAGYPEGHPQRIHKVEPGRKLTPTEERRASYRDDEKCQYVCSDADYRIELDYLKQKQDAGAQFIVTQMFFDCDVFEDFVKACRAHGITIPIIPGIMCITAYGGFKRMTGFCQTRVPQDVAAAMEDIKDDADAVKDFGIAFGTKMCQRLLKFGCTGLHFYTLNLETVPEGILANLGLGKSAIKAN